MADTPFPLPRATRQTDVLLGDGVTTTFGPFSFKIFDIEDVKVYTKTTGQTAFQPASVTVAKTSAAAFAFFTVTFAAAPASTTKIVVTGLRDPMRQLAVTKGGSMAGAELEKELSKQAIALSEFRRDLNRSLVADLDDASLPRTVTMGTGVVGGPLLRRSNNWEVGAESYDALRGRVDATEGVNTTQAAQISALQATDASHAATLANHGGRLSAVEAFNAGQASHISALQAADAALQATDLAHAAWLGTHGTRISNLEQLTDILSESVAGIAVLVSTLAALATYPWPLEEVRVLEYSSGIGKPAVYRHVAADPGHDLSAPRLAGGYWEIAEAELSPFHAGAPTDGSDAQPAWVRLINAAQVTGRKIAWSWPGDFYFGASINLPDNAILTIEGPGRDYCTFTGARDVTPFKVNKGGNTCVKLFRISGIEFDGQNDRANGYPLNQNTASANYGIYNPLVLDADALDPTGSEVEISYCRFKDLPALPFVLTHFERAAAHHNEILRTLDAGFVFCDEVHFYANHCKDGGDNGVSASRGCRKVFVYNNVFEDNEQHNIWISGFNVAGAGTATVSGASYVAGATVTLAISGGGLADFRVGQRATLVSGSDEAEVEIISIDSTLSAQAVLVDACPASLQNIATATWYWGGALGPSEVHVYGNTAQGGYGSNVYLGFAPRSLKVYDNNLKRAGYTTNWSKKTRGTIVKGSTTLVVDDAVLANGDYVIVKTKDSQSDSYFISQVSSGGGTTTLTLSSAPSDLYLNCEVAGLLTPNSTTSASVRVDGNTVGADKGARAIDITDNRCIDFVRYGVDVGGSALVGAANLVIDGITASVAMSPAAISARFAVNLREPASGKTIQPAFISQIRMIDTNNGSNGVVRLAQYGATPRQQQYLSDLFGSDPALAEVRAYDLADASADISAAFHYARRTNTNRLEVDQIDFHSSETVAGATTMAISKTMVAVSLSGATAVTDFTRESGGAFQLFILRNASGTHTLTLTHDTAKIRCPGATNYALAPNTAVLCLFISANIVQVIGSAV